MLFRPGAQDRLHSIEAQLAAWGEEADRFRAAAIAARRGAPPPDTLLSAAEEVHDGLAALMEDLDRALDGLPAGHAEFSALLGAQGTALALLESVGNSLDVLFDTTPGGRSAAISIARVPAPAAP